jgi:pimeloyl-ACP methyl ester carboxylesterase
MGLTGASCEEIAAARSSPMWAASVALEHTLSYDAACLGDGQPPTARLAKITQPALVAIGDYPVGAPGWIGALGPAAAAMAASIPRAMRVTIEGQSHVAEPKVVAGVLKRFFRQA